MILKALELVAITVSALVGGMFWGPWLALSRSMATFEPGIFIPIVQRMNRNMAPVMTVLMPTGLMSIVPVLFLSYGQKPVAFYLTLIALAMFVVALIVTVVIEVPIVTKIASWSVSTLPDNWYELRDRWGRFHVIRVVASFAGLVFLAAGAIS